MSQRAYFLMLLVNLGIQRLQEVSINRRPWREHELAVQIVPKSSCCFATQTTKLSGSPAGQRKQ
jgi:hypothetical protein